MPYTFAAHLHAVAWLVASRQSQMTKILLVPTVDGSTVTFFPTEKHLLGEYGFSLWDAKWKYVTRGGETSFSTSPRESVKIIPIHFAPYYLSFFVSTLTLSDHQLACGASSNLCLTLGSAISQQHNTTASLLTNIDTIHQENASAWCCVRQLDIEKYSMKIIVRLSYYLEERGNQSDS